MQSVLKKIDLPSFEPFPFFKSGHAQTVLSQIFPYIPIVKNTIRHQVTLSDNDIIILVENAPQTFKHVSNKIVLLVHGLTGSQDSSYMQRGAHYLSQAGFRVFRMNLRGCGAGFHYAKKLYHSGRSQDVQEVITWLSSRYPLSPISLIGFSLGANIVLKLAGELGNGLYTAPRLQSVLAISPPLNLEASVKLLLHKKNHFFNDYFVKRLVSDIQAKSSFIPGLPNLKQTSIKSVLDFDEQITAPHNGFKNAKDYYQQSSSGQYIPAITHPTLILHSQDDPFIGNAEFYKLPKKANLDLLLTKKGGHVSWLGKTDLSFNFRWMDRVILKWTNWINYQ